MHGFPQWTALDALTVEYKTHSLDIAIRLAVGVNSACGMDHAGSTAHSALDRLLIDRLLALHTQVLVKHNGAEPVVAVAVGVGIGMEGDALHIAEGLGITPGNAVMVGDMVVENRHLATPNAGTDVAHAVVVTNLLVVIIGIGLTRLRGVEHHTPP